MRPRNSIHPTFQYAIRQTNISNHGQQRPQWGLYKNISVYLPLESNWLRYTGSRTGLIATADDALLSASQRVSPCDVIDPTTTAISTAARKCLRRHSNVNEKGYASVSFMVHFTTLVKLTPRSTFLFDKLTVTWLFKNFPFHTASKGPLQYSKEPATTYHEPVECRPNDHTVFL